MRPLLPSIIRPMLRIYKTQKYFRPLRVRFLWVLSPELGVGQMNNDFLRTR